MALMDSIELKNGSVIDDEKKALIAASGSVTENLVLSIDMTKFDGAFIDYVIYTETYRKFGRLGIFWVNNGSVDPAINEVFSEAFNNIFEYDPVFDLRENGDFIELVLTVPASTETWNIKTLNAKL